MRKRLAKLPSPAMTVAFMALLAALTGTAVALPGSNTVTSGDIVNGQVKTQDIRNSTVRGRDVRNNTLTGSDVNNNSLTGSDVNEDSLGTVPRASAASTANFAGLAGAANAANSVGGVTLRGINFQANADVAGTAVLNLLGLTLTASCTGSDLEVEASSTVAGSQLSSTSLDSISEEVDNPILSDDLPGDSPLSIVNEDDVSQNGKTEFSTPAGRGVSVTWAADEGGGGPDCEFTGNALGH